MVLTSDNFTSNFIIRRTLLQSTTSLFFLFQFFLIFLDWKNSKMKLLLTFSILALSTLISANPKDNPGQRSSVKEHIRTKRQGADGAVKPLGVQGPLTPEESAKLKVARDAGKETRGKRSLFNPKPSRGHRSSYRGALAWGSGEGQFTSSSIPYSSASHYENYGPQSRSSHAYRPSRVVHYSSGNVPYSSGNSDNYQTYGSSSTSTNAWVADPPSTSYQTIDQKGHYRTIPASEATLRHSGTITAGSIGEIELGRNLTIINYIGFNTRIQAKFDVTNRDLAEAVRFKNSIKGDPVLQNKIVINPDGVTCGDICDERKPEVTHGTIGLCTAQFCQCRVATGNSRRNYRQGVCPANHIFDLETLTCELPQNTILCSDDPVPPELISNDLLTLGGRRNTGRLQLVYLIQPQQLLTTQQQFVAPPTPPVVLVQPQQQNLFN